ncbi:MAG: hypothetical protein GEU74_13045 [Nitriliruptorales bacterium]|nr:hypothetical protein [Nitriliruptorales bacterium]
MTDEHATGHSAGPLRLILPVAADRLAWRCPRRSVAADTGETVFHYEHQRTGRWLRLDQSGRVYGQDPQGVVRLFGRGGALALAVALNAVYDGMDHHRPTEVVLLGAATSEGARSRRASRG